MIGPVKLSHIQIRGYVCMCVQRGKQADRGIDSQKQRQRETERLVSSLGKWPNSCIVTVVTMTVKCDNVVKCLPGS